MIKTLVAFVAGVVVTLGGVWVVDAAHYAEAMPQASLGLAKPMEPMTSTSAQILSGTPGFRVAAFSDSPDHKHLSGVWAADGPSKFIWSYGADEVVYINEGEVEIEYLGRKHLLKPGETAYFQAGTKATWTVPKFVRKSWTIHHSNSLTRWMRQFTAPTPKAEAVSPTDPA